MCNMLIRLVFAISLVNAILGAGDDAEVKLLDFENVMDGEMYRFSYSQSDGQAREEVGNIINKGTPEEELVVTGRYSYRTGNGENFVVEYKADKKGYQPIIVNKKLARNRLSPNIAASLVG